MVVDDHDNLAGLPPTPSVQTMFTWACSSHQNDLGCEERAWLKIRKTPNQTLTCNPRSAISAVLARCLSLDLNIRRASEHWRGRARRRRRGKYVLYSRAELFHFPLLGLEGLLLPDVVQQRVAESDLRAFTVPRGGRLGVLGSRIKVAGWVKVQREMA